MGVGVEVEVEVEVGETEVGMGSWLKQCILMLQSSHGLFP